MNNNNHKATFTPAPPAAAHPPVKGHTVPDRSVFLAWATFGISVFAGTGRDPKLRFHAYQSAIYVLMALAAHALFGALDVLAPFRPIFDLASVGAFGFLLWRAWEGRPISLPVIAEIARKQADAGGSDPTGSVQ